MAGHWGMFRKVFRAVPKHEKSTLSEEELRRIFMEHDKDGDGHLNKNDLKKAFRRLGSRLPHYRADRAIHYTDIDGDGVINEHEIDHLVSYAIHYGYNLK